MESANERKEPRERECVCLGWKGLDTFKYMSDKGEQQKRERDKDRERVGVFSCE